MLSSDHDGDSYPRSMRHRQVLDAAAENPDASIDEIASMVPSATADLVEQVFEEHGDPAADEDESSMSTSNTPADEATADAEQPTTDDAADEPGESEQTNEEAGSVDPETLSDRQRELLELVAARPEATQTDIADHFDVTRATVSRWADDIDGFEWDERAAIVDRVVETPAAMSTDGGSAAGTAGDGSSTDDAGSPEHAEGETGVTAPDQDRSRESIFEEPDLLHKVIHACMESEAVSTEEELRIIESLMK